ncbi:MAG: hypothetical protein IJS39_00910 [Synergistaceae bacterium]|nr:hypothetical protein [Synergistaceae bacterium]
MKYRMYLSVAAVFLMVLCSAYASHASDSVYLAGEFKDGVYTNGALGTEAHFGSQWTALSPQEIAAIDAEVGKLLANSSSLTVEELMNMELPVFYMVTPDAADRVYMTVSNVGSAIVSVMTDPDTKAVVNSIMEDMADALRKNNSAMGLETTVNTIWTNFLGSERPCLYVKTMVSSTKPMYQKQVMCFKGEHHFQVTVESMNRDITDELLAMFQKIN